MEEGIKIKNMNDLDAIKPGKNKVCGLCGVFLTKENTSEWHYFDTPCTVAKQCHDCNDKPMDMIIK